MRINEISDHFINLHVVEERNLAWKVSSVYGWPENGQKFKTWEMINSLGRNNNLPWLIGGDFNEVLQDAEKKGGHPCEFYNLFAFRNCLDMNGFRDLGDVGHPYTWSNNRTEGYIEERLDRCVASEEWRSMFPMAIVENVIWDGSDHSPIILYPKGHVENSNHMYRDDGKIFRFKARWTHFDNFDKEIETF